MLRALVFALLALSVYGQGATPSCGETGEGACPAAGDSAGADVSSYEEELASNLQQAQTSLKDMAERAATAERLAAQRDTEIAAVRAACQARESPAEIARLETALANAEQRAQEVTERCRGITPNLAYVLRGFLSYTGVFVAATARMSTHFILL